MLSCGTGKFYDCTFSASWDFFASSFSTKYTESPGLVSAVGRVNLLPREKGWPFLWLFLFLVLFWHFIFLHITRTGSYRDSHKSSCCPMSFSSTIFTLVFIQVPLHLQDEMVMAECLWLQIPLRLRRPSAVPLIQTQPRSFPTLNLQ